MDASFTNGLFVCFQADRTVKTPPRRELVTTVESTSLQKVHKNSAVLILLLAFESAFVAAVRETGLTPLPVGFCRTELGLPSGKNAVHPLTH